MEKRISLVSIILKFIVIVSAVLGTALCIYTGRNSFMGGTYVFMYFTIQSNIALAILCLIEAIMFFRKKEAGPVWQIVKLVGAVSITLTGVVFCVVLAPTMGKQAWGLINILTHVIVPVCSVADFFLVAQNFKYKKIHALWVILPPLAYSIYAGIGFVNNWQFAEGINYPYFFLNWGSPAGAFGFTKELPFMGCAWWILILLGFLIGIGLLYIKIASSIQKRKHK